MADTDQLTRYLDDMREDADVVSFSGTTVKPLIEVIDAALNLADAWERNGAEKNGIGDAEARTLGVCASALREYMVTTLLRNLP